MENPRIFISYRRSTCSTQADYLHKRILARDSTRNVFYDCESIPYATDWKECFLDNIGQASLVIILVSKATLDTFKDDSRPDNVLLEWDMAVSRYLERKIQLLLVLFLEKGEEDFAFGSVPGHETVAEGCIRSFKEIWTELSKVNGIQIQFSRQHDMEALDTCITTLVPITSHSAPSISADPLGPSNPTNEPETSHPTDLIDEPRVFIGREDVLRFLSISFSDTTKGAAAILHGGPGIGKTTVSSHYATSSSENSKYTIAIWISLVSEFTFQEDVKRWCEVLRIPLDDDFEIVRSKFFAWLKQNRGYLIVFDNADDENIVKSCLGKLTKINGHTLITTRNPAIDEFIPLGVDINRKFREEIKIWPDNVTREYVKYRLDSRLPKSDSENQYLDKIMEFLNGYPLLVEQMCSFLANGPGRSLKKYHELLESKDPKIFNQRPESATSRYERTIDATFGIVIDDFKKSGNRAACVLLGAIGCVSNSNIPIETYLAEYLIQAGIDTDVYDVVSTLLKVSLLKMGQDGMSVSIHLAMQDVIRRTLASTDYLDCGFNEVAISVLDSIIPKENSNRTFEPSTLLIGTHLLPHISELYTTTKLQTSELADLLFCAGDFSDHIGNYNMARTLFSSSIKIFTFVNGSRECADVSKAINYLGDIAKTLGDYVEARKLYNESLEIKEKVYGTRQHASIAVTINNLGDIAMKQGDYVEARKLYNESIEIYEKVYGTRQHANISVTINNLGDIAKMQGDYVEARKLYNESIEIDEKVYGTRQHASISVTINNLGDIAMMQGDYVEARKLYNESLEIDEKVFGTRQHYGISVILSNLGDIAKMQGDYVEARKLYYESLEIDEKVYGTRQHASISVTINNLGDIAKMQGDYVEAKKLYNESLEIVEKAFGGQEHADVAFTLNELGVVARLDGDYEESVKLHSESLSIYERVFGSKSHPHIARSLRDLGSTYKAMGDFESARLKYSESLEMCVQIFETSHWRFLEIKELLEELIMKEKESDFEMSNDAELDRQETWVASVPTRELGIAKETKKNTFKNFNIFKSKGKK